MVLPVTLAGAPCCWGVDDINNPHLPPWERVLDESSGLGLSSLELGPYGYIPLDIQLVTDALQKRGLTIIAGTIFNNLVDPNNKSLLLEQTDKICSLITQLPKPFNHPNQRYAVPYLNVIDFDHDERDYAAGHVDTAPRLSDTDWKHMMSNITDIAQFAKDNYNIRTTIHPHAGGYLEFADELERVVDDIPEHVAGLCLDTGHMTYAKTDPLEALRKYAHRTDYIHFKDIDAKVYQTVMNEHIRFFDACGKGVFCPLGTGNIDYQNIRFLLEEIGYSGYITIEQDRDPQNDSSILEDLGTSIKFLQQTGFGNLD